MLEWLEKRTKSAYLRSLEAEVIRLREDNRQLVNSILAAHGMQGIDVQRQAKDMKPIHRVSWLDLRRKLERRAANPAVAPQPAAGNQTDA